MSAGREFQVDGAATEKALRSTLSNRPSSWLCWLITFMNCGNWQHGAS